MIILQAIASFLSTNAGKALTEDAVNALEYMIEAEMKHRRDVANNSVACVAPSATTLANKQ